ncbi:MAG: flavodoxin domain-containing protein [Paraglaciecola sp.]|uniref:flavodoxin domain-containing protein n=1 Tax=Paraglaciecola sp. TaxID=1920173 RepID=UPI00273E53E1|nr:flavodoxin domain-containing protein [Paraglaciecola sp.]MDP5031461.1 flavodoxin domain-containing protein [Paraglaciecola sp.]MDP5130806.1 flavodoxin domain-containing protein [Paraglaciecola sp.]
MSNIGIFVGSVYGNAQHVADEVKAALVDEGLSATVYNDPSVSDFQQASSVIVVSSTTGMGDVPPNLEFFIQDLRDQMPLMANKPFAVAGLGDSSYGETYCGAGNQIFSLLEELQGNPIADLLEVDACETLEPEVEVVEWIKGLVKYMV